MTGDKAVELINEWLNLAKEVGDMNLNRMEYIFFFQASIFFM